MAEDREAGPNSCVEFEGSTTERENDNDHDSSAITVTDRNATSTGEAGEARESEKTGRGGDEHIVNVKTEVILLDEAPAAKIAGSVVKSCENRRVIELSDTMSKMELRRQFRVDVASHEGSARGSGDCRGIFGGEDADDDDDGSAEILSRLPPGTILIKQGASGASTRNCGREDSDYVHDSSKDSTETNSSGSSSATSYAAAGKVKRMQHRSVRSKKIVEVRRNPARNKKKKPIDDDFQRPRQRLLSVKRKPGFVVEAVARKRAKIASVPYMNTRSVTRKMYTVGATYQAPTIHDATEWKEWPAHGMHERPVWHPQFGLAFGYNDRHFLSLDDRTYREIIDDSVIEVVSVDPHPKRNLEKLRPKYLDPDCLETRDDKVSTKTSNGSSFEACMHGSLHSVLAYCARVVTPTYKNAVDTKLRKITQSTSISDNSKSEEALKLLPEVAKGSQNESKIGVPSLSTQPRSSSKIAAASHSPSTSSSSSEVPKCLVVPRRTISFTNVRNIQGNILHEVFGRASKNTLIFLKPTDPPVKPEKIGTTAKATSVKSNATVTKDSVECVTEDFNLAKLDDNAISDEALMEMSSMYNKILPSEEVEAAVKTAAEVTPQMAVVPANVSKRSPITEAKDHQLPNRIRASSSGPACQDPSGSKTAEKSRASRPSNCNQASEIAKILAEYNQKAATNPGAKGASYATTNALNAKTNNAKPGKSEKDCGNSQGSRTTFLSVVEQPKRMRREDDVGRKTYRGCSSLSKQESSVDVSVAADKVPKTDIPIKTEESDKNVDDNSRAIDLTTAKSRKTKVQQQPENQPDEPMNRQWLQELIEDTALLYCAAAGVRQDDVVNYLDTLDSTQSIEWLGS